LGQTYQISEYYGKYPLYENLWLLNEKLPEIACESYNPPFSSLVDFALRTAVTVEELQAHVKKFLSEISLKILVVGNMYKEVSVPR
jgi:insulysin